MTNTEKIRLKKEIVRLTKKHSHAETCKILNKKGVRTPYGLKPNTHFIANVLSGLTLVVTKRKKRN